MESGSEGGLSRRRFLARAGGVTAATAGVVPFSVVGQSSAGTNWPMRRGDAANTGTHSGVAPTDSIEKRWQFRVSGRPLTEATVVGKTVYVGGGNSVYALSAATGERRWRFRTGDSVRTAPTVQDGTVYVGSTDSNVYALSAADGSEQWSAQLGLSILAAPVPVGDTVYVGGRNGQVCALNGATGAERWVFSTDDPIYASPAVVDGIVYTVNGSGTTFAIDAESGRRYWETQVRGDVRSPPVVVNGTIHIASMSDRVIALGTRFGERRWAKEIPLQTPATLAVTGSELAVPGTNGTLYVLDPDTGAERYQFNAGLQCYSPVIVDGVLCLGTGSGVQAIDATASTQYWSYSLGSATHPTLSVADGVVYAAGEGGTLYAMVGPETPAPGSDPAESATSTPTASGTEPPVGGQSGSGATPTTPTPTPEPAGATDTATPAANAGTPQPSPLGGNRILIGGIGSAVVGAVLLAGYLGRRGDADSGPAGLATESRDTAGGTDTESGSDREDWSIGASPDVLVEKATQALDEGRSAKEDGEHGRAAARLEEAVETYNRALSAVDDDRAGEVRDDLETAKAALLSVDSVRQTLDEVEELLAAAEADMENAITAFVTDQRTVARVRFRQARDRYERAIGLLDDDDIEQLWLSVAVSTNEPLDEIEKFDEIPGVDDDAIDALRETGYESPTDLRDLSVEELSTTAGVGDETATRLKVAGWHTPSNERRFESVGDVTARLESAAFGYALVA